MSTSKSNSSQGRLWFILGGVVTMIFGFLAIGRPGMATFAIEQLLGIFCLVSGIILLISALYDRAGHRFFELLWAILRVALGVILLANAIQGILALTIVLAALFLAEGLVAVVFSVRVRETNPAWVWLLLNGFVAIILGGMLLAKFPGDAAWAVGLLFGINAVFLGFSLLMFGTYAGAKRDS